MTGVGAECRRLRLSTTEGPPLFTAFEASLLSIAALYQDTRSLTHYPIRQITNLATLPTSFASATMQKRPPVSMTEGGKPSEAGENEAIVARPRRTRSQTMARTTTTAQQLFCFVTGSATLESTGNDSVAFCWKLISRPGAGASRRKRKDHAMGCDGTHRNGGAYACGTRHENGVRQSHEANLKWVCGNRDGVTKRQSCLLPPDSGRVVIQQTEIHQLLLSLSIDSFSPDSARYFRSGLGSVNIGRRKSQPGCVALGLADQRATHQVPAIQSISD